MQKVVTATTAPTHNLYFARESGSRKPIPARAQSTGTTGWSQSPLEHHNLNPDFTTEVSHAPSLSKTAFLRIPVDLERFICARLATVSFILHPLDSKTFSNACPYEHRRHVKS
jgi:hypothetical protein